MATQEQTFVEWIEDEISTVRKIYELSHTEGWRSQLETLQRVKREYLARIAHDKQPYQKSE